MTQTSGGGGGNSNDGDNDGVQNGNDNCPNDANSDQSDLTVTALAMSATRTLMATAQVMSKKPMRVLTPMIRTLHLRRLLSIKMMMG